MQKIFSIALLALSVSGFSQVKFAAKANLLFNTSSPSWNDISNTAVQAYGDSGKNNVGFNVGLSAKIDLPVTSLFVMPEIYYTSLKSEFDLPGKNTQFEVKSNRIDVPVLLGYNLLGEKLGVFIGPVASYNLAGDEEFNNFKEKAKNDFLVGYQFGAQVQLRNLIINGRYEGAFSKDQRDFINSNTNTTIRYDNRPSLVMLGLGYQF